MKKLTTEEFITKATAVHGNKYGYDNSYYTKSTGPISITCTIHGEFKQQPNNHLQGAGCPKCHGHYKRTSEETISDFASIHNEFYDYSKTIYTDMKTKVTITCPTHGDFEQLPGSHMSGHGCKQCADIKTKEAIQSSTEEWVTKAKLVHGNKYDYSKVVYTAAKNKVTIMCLEHGDFEQTPNNHTNQSQGCPNCGLESNIGRFLSNTLEFIKKAVMVHGDKYRYDMVNYLGNRAPISITCTTHGSFKQTPHAHLRGYGCTSCAKYGFDKNKPGLLYILSINNGEAYKVGITNYTVARRYPKVDLNKIECFYEKRYETGIDAFIEEQKILNLFKEYKYYGPPLLTSGNTEILTKGVQWDTYFTKSQ